MPQTLLESTPQNASRRSLSLRLAVRTCTILAIYATLTFLAAGTWNYWQAWLFPVVSVLPVLILFAWLIAVDPRTVERRLESREPSPAQQNLIRYFKYVFLLVFLVPGFDQRFGWSRAVFGPVPTWICLAAEGLVLAAMLLIGWTVQVNRFAARTIRVEAGQQVISTGPYRLVRHPLYSGSVLLMLAMPVALASWIAVPLFALLIPFYVLRLLNEEKLLLRELPGYEAYCRQTRNHLVPFVW